VNTIGRNAAGNFVDILAPILFLNLDNQTKYWRLEHCCFAVHRKSRCEYFWPLLWSPCENVQIDVPLGIGERKKQKCMACYSDVDSNINTLCCCINIQNVNHQNVDILMVDGKW